MIDLIELNPKQSLGITMASPKSLSDNEKVLPKEEDDSHLPPCLQRRNREHSSSSEDEDKPKSKKDHNETTDSESDSDVTPSRDGEKCNTEDKAPKESEEKEVRPSKKVYHQHKRALLLSGPVKGFR